MQRPVTRRDFLWQAGGGLGGIALSQLLAAEGLLASAEPQSDAAAGGGLHHPAKARRVGDAVHVGRGQSTRHIRLQASVA